MTWYHGKRTSWIFESVKSRDLKQSLLVADLVREMSNPFETRCKTGVVKRWRWCALKNAKAQMSCIKWWCASRGLKYLCSNLYGIIPFPPTLVCIKIRQLRGLRWSWLARDDGGGVNEPISPCKEGEEYTRKSQLPFLVVFETSKATKRQRISVSGKLIGCKLRVYHWRRVELFASLTMLSASYEKPLRTLPSLDHRDYDRMTSNVQKKIV